VTTPENWLPVVGWEGLYEVSDQGRVRSLDRLTERNGRPYRLRGRVLKPHRTPPMGYLAVTLYADGNVRKARVHVLVAESFIGNRPENATMVCHNDGDHDNNRPSNLRWGNQFGNMRDMSQHGRSHASWTRCKRGHEFTPENTRITTNGGRQCRECIREANGAVRRRGPYKSRGVS
jgi:hypothetical protein